MNLTQHYALTLTLTLTLNRSDAHHMMFMLNGCDAPYDIHAKWM